MFGLITSRHSLCRAPLISRLYTTSTIPLQSPDIHNPSIDPLYDPYAYLQHDTAAAQRLLHRHTQNFNHYMTSTGATTLQQQLLQETLGLAPAVQTSTHPETLGTYHYYMQQTEQRPHPCFYRLPASNISKQTTTTTALLPEVVLDMNELATVYGDDITLGQLKLTHCQNIVVFTLSTTTSEERYNGFTREIPTGKIQQHRELEGIVSLEVARDGETVGFTTPDELGRPNKVWLCNTILKTKTPSTSNLKKNKNTTTTSVGGGGSSSGGVYLVYEERDPRFFLDLQRTKDWSYLAINAMSKISSEVHLLLPSKNINTSSTNSNSGSGMFETVCVAERKEGVQYYIEHRKGILWMMTNAGQQQQQQHKSFHLRRRPATDIITVSSSSSSSSGGGTTSSSIEDSWKEVVPIYDSTTSTTTSTTTSMMNEKKKEGVQELTDFDVFDCGVVTYGTTADGYSTIHLLGDNDGSGSSGDVHVHCLMSTKTAQVSSSSNPDNNTSPLQRVLSIQPGMNADFYSTNLRLDLSSPILPSISVDFDLLSSSPTATTPNDNNSTTNTQLLSPPPILLPTTDNNNTEHRQQRQQQEEEATTKIRNYLSTNFDCYRIYTDNENNDTATTTTPKMPKIPITICHKRGLPLDGTHPCLLVVYGSYGHNLPLHFHPEKIPLLHRNWIVAFVHTRGGSECGLHWHTSAQGPSLKINSGVDVVTAIEYLTKKGYSGGGKFAIETNSAGGITAGIALSRDPSLFSVALLEAPFVDVVSTMRDEGLPLVVHEREEFGDPGDVVQLREMLKWDPYRNIDSDSGIYSINTSRSFDGGGGGGGGGTVVVDGFERGGRERRRRRWPSMLISLQEEDERVPWWGPLKYAQRVADAQVDDSRPILVWPNAHDGHLAPEREHFSFKSTQYAFLIKATEENTTKR